MKSVATILKGIARTAGGIAFILGMLAFLGAWGWLTTGNPKVAELQGRWWAGYYGTALFGRQWCVVRFFQSETGQLRMALLLPVGEPRYYEVDREPGMTFVYLTFIDNAAEPPIRIEAKQLYVGRRYHIERLLAGRFTDFWKGNDDEHIEGSIVSLVPPEEFAVEPMEDDELEAFWGYVRPFEPTPLPTDILPSSRVVPAGTF